MLEKLFNVSVVCFFLFSNQFDVYFPLSQIMVMNTAQRKIKIKLTSLKILKTKKYI